MTKGVVHYISSKTKPLECVTQAGTPIFLTWCGATYLSKIKQKERWVDSRSKVTCKNCIRQGGIHP